MKFFNQSGSEMTRTHLSESDRVCLCCQSFDHEAAEMLHDDAFCQKCQSLCRCSCHRGSEQ